MRKMSMQLFDAGARFRYQEQLDDASAWCNQEDILAFRELSLATVLVILGAGVLQQLRLYLSVRKL